MNYVYFRWPGHQMTSSDLQMTSKCPTVIWKHIFFYLLEPLIELQTTPYF